MKFTLRRVALTSLALGVCSAGIAQETVPIEYYRPLRNSVSVGVRVIGGNAKVGFKNLGGYDSRSRRFGTGEGSYDNGAWSGDGRRGISNGNNRSFIDSPTTGPDSESTYFTENGGSRIVSADGTTVTWTERVPLAGGNRYQLETHERYTDPNGTGSYHRKRIQGEYVNFDPATQSGTTRTWQFGSLSQIGSDTSGTYVDMSNYSTLPSGGSAQAESSNSSGVEIQFAYIIKRYKRLEWGISVSAGASTISATTNDTVRARLLKETDRFRIVGRDRNGDPVTAATFTYPGYSSPNSTTRDGTIETITGVAPIPPADQYSYFVENSLFLDHASKQSLGISEAGQVDVFGNWRIKGAYYLLRVGPTVRFTLNKNWTVSVGAGFAGAYSGTRFIVDEFYERPDVSGTIRYQDESEEKRFVPGYYGDINLERWLSVRTGFYLGYGYEKLGDYTQHVGSRSAEIDLGTSKGFRFGIITRF